MSTTRHVLGLLGTGFAICMWLGMLFVLSAIGVGPFPGAFGLVLLGLFYCWMVSAYYHYQHGRQDELLHVLACVVDANAPLAPALWAYLDDRPRGPWRETWVFVMLLFVVPGYYWFRHRWHNFDSKVARVAHRLEHGYSLAEALQSVPGVLPRDIILSVAVGESTGQLARCLRSAAATRLTSIWAELLPRVLYPFFILLITANILSFWAIYIAPKFEAIAKDFGTRPPETTRYLMATLSWLGANFSWLLGTVFLGMLASVLIISSSYLKWFLCWGCGRFYQMYVQHRVLRLLSQLIEVEKPVPEALRYLVDTRFGSLLMRHRLRLVARRVEQGDPLASTLHRYGLLPRNMVPLVQSAERVGNLAWALRELAESRANRLVRLLRQLSTLLWPVIVLLIGAMVAFITLGMFLPLIDLIMRVAE